MGNHVECILVDGTILNFDNLCTTVREYTSDAFISVAKNPKTSVELNLEIVPKIQIKRILFCNTENEILKVKSNTAIEKVD